MKKIKRKKLNLKKNFKFIIIIFLLLFVLSFLTLILDFNNVIQPDNTIPVDGLTLSDNQVII